jgi:SAM-dependent methyltransferase
MAAIELDPQLETELHEWLTQYATEHGFSRTKAKVWVNGLSNVARGEELLRTLETRFGVPLDGRTAADIGCGFGGMALALRQRFDTVHAFDLEPDRVHWTSRRVPGVRAAVASVTSLPVDRDTYDLIICNDVLEHVTYADQHLAVAEFWRTLRPGAYVSIDVPNRLQLIDDHNGLPFGTWLPHPLRKRYVERFSSNRDYVRCWERTGPGWTSLFQRFGFMTEIAGIHIRNLKWTPARAWHIVARKPPS